MKLLKVKDTKAKEILKKLVESKYLLKVGLRRNTYYEWNESNT
jgi:hypothetical protein